MLKAQPTEKNWLVSVHSYKLVHYELSQLFVLTGSGCTFYRHVHQVKGLNLLTNLSGFGLLGLISLSDQLSIESFIQYTLIEFLIGHFKNVHG